jgi:LemA protein
MIPTHFLIWILVGAVVLYAVVVFNGLISLRIRGKAAWSDIDVQLKLRHTLIPSMIEVVKGYASHEKGTFERITEARQRGMAAQAVGQKGAAESDLSGAVHGLLAVAENYPQLKANENFLDLQKRLAGVEDQLQNARRYYNAVVRDFNTKSATFPNLLIASLFHFSQMEYFQLDDASERNAPEVKLS